MGLDSGQRFPFDQHRKRFVLFGGHQIAEPRAFRQLRRRVGRQMHFVRGHFRNRFASNIGHPKSLQLKTIFTLKFSPMEARTAQETIFDISQSRFPQLAAGGAARRRGHRRRRGATQVGRSRWRHYCEWVGFEVTREFDKDI